MDKISVCIPLGKGSDWDDNELRLTLRSLEKHLKVPHNIFLFVDPRNIPDWVQNVTIKKVPRSYPEKAKEHFQGAKHYENYFDVLHKIEAMVYDSDTSEEFLMFYDDSHLVKDIGSLSDFVCPVAVQKYEDKPAGYERRRGKWLKTVGQAMDYLGDKGRPRFDYESHLPRYFTKSGWRELFKRFPVDEQLIPYAPSTLYYNWFYDKPVVDLMRDENNVKVGFYGDRPAQRGDQGAFKSSTRESIEKAVEGKMFLNYNDVGLTSELKNFLFDIFNEKSVYER